MFRTWDGALPMATRFTSHPVASVNFDQLPSGSETPTSAKLMVPLDAAWADCISGQVAEPAETAVIVASEFLIISRLVMVIVPSPPSDWSGSIVAVARPRDRKRGAAASMRLSSTVMESDPSPRALAIGRTACNRQYIDAR